jgi:hypothetical protein
LVSQNHRLTNDVFSVRYELYPLQDLRPFDAQMRCTNSRDERGQLTAAGKRELADADEEIALLSEQIKNWREGVRQHSGCNEPSWEPVNAGGPRCDTAEAKQSIIAARWSSVESRVTNKIIASADKRLSDKRLLEGTGR